MKETLIDILWDFAHSTAKATLNPKLKTHDATRAEYKQLAYKAANEIIHTIKAHEQSKLQSKITQTSTIE